MDAYGDLTNLNSANGSATSTGPSTWASSASNSLSTLFGKKYTGNITTWYPYAAAKTPSPSPTSTPVVATRSSVPTWVGPVLGVVLGLVAITAIVVGILLWRKRKYLRRQSTSAASTSGYNGSRIMRWVYGMPPPNPKAATTITSSEVGDVETLGSPGTEHAAMFPAHEVEGSQRYEMHGTSFPSLILTHKPLTLTLLKTAVSAPVELPTDYNNNPNSPYPLYSDYGTSRAVSPPTDYSAASSPPNSSAVPSRRPTHKRNESSLSSGANLPSPDIVVTPEEDFRRSEYLDELPSPRSGAASPVSPDGRRDPSASASASAEAARRRAGGRRQSSFAESLTEEEARH